MKRSIHEELVKAIKMSASANENPVDLLIDIFPMSKEAAYSRLRGDIQFTLDEAACISRKLKTSLKVLFDNRTDTQRINFHLYRLNDLTEDDTTQYLEMLKEMKASFAFIASDPYKPLLSAAFSFLPSEFLYTNKLLARFNLFKWIYQKTKTKSIPRLSDIELPDQIEEVQSEFVHLVRRFNCIYVFEEDIFHSVVKDIRFFYRLGLINDEELNSLKEALHAFINTIENYANTGKNENGRPVSIYVSEITFDATYIYVEREDGYKIFATNLFGLNFLGSEDSDICQTQKEWIESLMRYSNGITKSGEMERLKFLSKQRAFVDSL